MARQFTLGRNERLKSRKAIEELFNGGKNFSLAPFRVHYLLMRGEGSTANSSKIEFGVGVSSKVFKKATDRNRIKRLMREAYRLQKNFLVEKLNTSNWKLRLFLVYTSKDAINFNIATAKLTLILNRLIKIIDENTSANS